MARVQNILQNLGIGDDASITMIALSEAELQAVGPELFGLGDQQMGDTTWGALLQIWKAAAFGSRRWLAAQGTLSCSPTVVTHLDSAAPPRS